MKNTELKDFLKRAGAAHLERRTSFDGDVGWWSVVDKDHAEIDTGLHPKELFNRVSGLACLGLYLRPVEHPAWSMALAAFDRKNEDILEKGGGCAYNLALSHRFLLCENPGDNKMLVVWSEKPDPSGTGLGNIDGDGHV